jgi:hypothetical protein
MGKIYLFPLGHYNIDYDHQNVHDKSSVQYQ